MSRVTICLTERCNLDCKYCFRKVTNVEDIECDNILDFMHRLNKVETIDEIYLTGGEPFLYKDLEKLLIKCNSVCNNLYILTNGILLNDKNIALAKKYKVKLHVSLDSYDARYHNIYRGGHSVIMKNLKILKNDPSIEINLNVTLSPLNLDQISLIEIFAEESGFTTDYSILSVDSNMENSWYKMKSNDISKLYNELSLWAQKNNRSIKLKFFNYILKNKNAKLKQCIYCKNNFVIKTNGDVCACFNNDNLYYGNIILEHPKKIIERYQTSMPELKYEDCFSLNCAGTYL